MPKFPSIESTALIAPAWSRATITIEQTNWWNRTKANRIVHSRVGTDVDLGVRICWYAKEENALSSRAQMFPLDGKWTKATLGSFHEWETIFSTISFAVRSVIFTKLNLLSSRKWFFSLCTSCVLAVYVFLLRKSFNRSDLKSARQWNANGNEIRAIIVFRFTSLPTNSTFLFSRHLCDSGRVAIQSVIVGELKMHVFFPEKIVWIFFIGNFFFFLLSHSSFSRREVKFTDVRKTDLNGIRNGLRLGWGAPLCWIN